MSKEYKKEEVIKMSKEYKKEEVIKMSKEYKKEEVIKMSKEYKKEEVIKMFVMQNCYIKKFAVSDNMDDHIKIYAIRPLKKNPSCFQAFASVATVLREGFKYSKDKVTLGLTSCKIYDRLHVKRCNNCQMSGHYVKDCPKQNIDSCGKCNEGHPTKDCPSLVLKFINSVRNKMDDVHHQATKYNCPS